MKFAELDGVVLRYRIAGDPKGPAILFANSLGTDLTIWDEVVERLPQGYAMIGYDKRGHGLSSLPGGAVGIEEHARDVTNLMNHLGIAEAVICGVSVGGMIAQKVASMAMGRVRGVVLCNTGAKIGAPEIWEQRIAAIAEGGLEPMADAVMERWFTEGFRLTRTAELTGCRAMLTSTSAEGYAATCAAIRDADLNDSTADLDIPALCIAGADDQATPPALVRALADLIEDSKYLEIPSCGHIPMVEQAEACADAIAGFLADLDTRVRPAFGKTANHVRGMAVRRQVLGDAHVNRASANATPMDVPFQQFITEGAWGSVWHGSHFTLRERSIVTLALLAAQGQDDEVAMHVRATANTGATQEDIAEALMHVAVYAGVPRANHALKIAKQVFAELEEG